MKTKIFVAALLVLSIAAAFAETSITIQLEKGENNVTINSFFYPIYVSTLIANNPQIQSVTLVDYGRNYGYVNVFGGVGLDFLIEQDKLYEIYANESVNITLR